MTPQEAIGQLRCNVEGDYINLDDLEAFELAISALEKQIPKKVVKHNGSELYHCPNCDTYFLGNGFKHCTDCGQALDWSDTE